MKLKRRSQEIRMEMTPLIDVIFLLLVFFVFALVLMVRADVLDLQLPRIATGSPSQQTQTIRITLAQDGSILVQGEPTQREQAGESVRLAISQSPDSTVILSADARAPAGALIELADALVVAGITEFSVQGAPAAPPDGAISPNPPDTSDE